MRTATSSRSIARPLAFVAASVLLAACSNGSNDIEAAPTVSGTNPGTQPGATMGMPVAGSNNVADASVMTVDSSSGPPPSPGSSAGGDSGVASGNLIANWSFESATVGTSGWQGWQSTLRRVANADAPNGHYVALVTEASGEGYSIQDNPNTIPSAVAGTTYAATAYAAAASASAAGKTVSLVLREEDANGNIVMLWPVSTTLTTTFQQLQTSATVQNSGDSLDIYIYQGGSTAGDAFFADAITLLAGGGGGSPPTVDAGQPDASTTVTITTPDSGAGTQNQCPCTTAPAMPTDVPSGYTRIFAEDFDTNATVGNFDNVYGSEFGEYVGPAPQPDGSEAAYVPTEVLSVANGSLYYDLHTDSSGTPVAAAPQPMSEQGFLYGQVGIAIRMDSETEPQNYKIAFLLWPTTGAWTNEVDFAETQPDLDVDFSINSLLTNNAPNFDLTDGNEDTGVNLTDGKYHTFLVTWTPAALTVSIDGVTKATFSAGSGADPAQEMRVSLQAEGWIPGGNAAIAPASAAVVEVPYIYINQYN
jgi:Carbohydrate binding domain/Glycosyl hydrolases family 16